MFQCSRNTQSLSHTHSHTHTHTHTLTHTHSHTQTRTHTEIHTHTHTHTWKQTHAHTGSCMYMYNSVHHMRHSYMYMLHATTALKLNLKLGIVPISLHACSIHFVSMYMYMKIQKVYLLLPIPNLRGNHPIACSGKPNPSKRQSH